MRFATFEHRGRGPGRGRQRRSDGPMRASTAGRGHRAGPGPSRVCRRRSAAGRSALAEPGIPVAEVRLLPPLDPPTVRDFVAFEEHVEGVVASVGDGAGVVPEWYQAPTFYFTNPYALIGAHDDVQIPSG